MMETEALDLKNPIYIPQQGIESEFIELDGERLPDNVYDVIGLLKVETASRDRWLRVACAYDRFGRRDYAITVLEEATSEAVDGMLSGDDAGSRIGLLTALGGAYVMDAAETVDPGKRRELLSKAAEALSRAEKINLDDPSVLAGKGWREFVAGDASLSGQWFENAKAGYSLSGMLGLAAVQLNQVGGKASDTVRLLKAALRDSRCPPGVWVGLGHALHNAGEDDAAKKSLQRAWLATEDGTDKDKLDSLVALAAIEAGSGDKERVGVAFSLLTHAYANCGGDEDPRVLSQLAEMFFLGNNGIRAEQLALKAFHLAEKESTGSNGELFTQYGRSLKAATSFQLARAQHLLGKTSSAEKNYALTISLSDSKSQDWTYLAALLKLGLLRLSFGNDVGATDCLEKVLKFKPNCWLANRALGVIIGRRRNLSSKEKSRAFDLLQAGILKDSDGLKDIPALLSFAQLLTESSPERALKMYNCALEASALAEVSLPHSVHNNIAALHSRLGNLDRTNKYITMLKTKAEDPAFCLTLSFNEARLAEMDGRLEEASSLYKSILNQCPEYLDAEVRLGCITMAKGDMEEAEKSFKAGLASPSVAVKATAFCYMAELLNKSNRDKDLQNLIEPEATKSGYGALAMSKFLYERLGNVPETRRIKMLSWIAANLMASLKRMPTNVFAANAVGVYLAHDRNIADAREAFAAAGACGSAARINLAHAQVEIGRKSSGKPPNLALLDQAAKLYSDAQQEGSLEKSYIMLCQARACFEATKFGEAAKLLRKVLEEKPSSPVVMFDLALALQESALSRSSLRKRTVKEMRSVEKEFEDARELFMKLEKPGIVGKDRFAHARMDPRVAHQHSKFLHQRMRTHKVALLNIEAEEEEANAERSRKKQQRLERERKAEEQRKAQQKAEEARKRHMQEAVEKMAEKLGKAKAKVKKEATDDEDSDEDNKGEGQPRKRKPTTRKVKSLKRARGALKDDSSEEYSDLDEDNDGEDMDPSGKKRSRFTIAEDDENENSERDMDDEITKLQAEEVVKDSGTPPA